MKKVKNTVRHDPAGGTYGDCHRACVCTILGLEPEEVPHFYEEGPNVAAEVQAKRIVDFLDSRGLVEGHVLYPADGPGGLPAILQTLGYMMIGVPLILGGISSIGSGHSVVVLDGEIYNDPTGSGIVGPMPDGHYWVTFFSPKPAQAA